MGRKLTGNVEWHAEGKGGHWDARVPAPDGTRPRIHLRKFTEHTDRGKNRAREAARARGELLKTAERIPAAPEKQGETADTWHERFLSSTIRAHLKRANSDSAAHWKNWISKDIGHLSMASLTRDDIERVRDRLDGAIRAKTLMAKSAGNIWSTLTTALKAAQNAKQRDLRIRADNPALNVLPPERGEARRKFWIYPTEFLALMACADVPLEWRQCYAIACYTYLRPNELHELRWQDVDLEIGEVHVTRAWDQFTDEIKLPKTTAGVRRVPIHASLAPLLKAMGEGKQAGDKILPCLEMDPASIALKVRSHLKKAGVTRLELFDLKSRTHKAVGFRSWRDSGITWEAIRGTDVIKLQRRAGHETAQTTLGYVKEAEDRSALVGAVFPPLPSNLLERGAISPEISPSKDPRNRKARATKREKRWPLRGLNPSKTSGDAVSSSETYSAVPSTPRATPPNPASPRELGNSQGDIPKPPRATALALLYEQAAALASAGDLVAARALHDTIGRLLGLDDGPPSKVIDITRKPTRG